MEMFYKGEKFMEAIGLVFLPFLLSILIVYLFLGIRYKKSTKHKGRVIESTDTEIVSFSSVFREIYETYDVWYEYKGEMKRGEVCTNRTRLRPGDSIDVYVYDKNGIYEIQNDIYWRKFMHCVGAFIIAGAFCIIALLLFWGMSLSSQNQSYGVCIKQDFSHATDYNDELIENE